MPSIQVLAYADNYFVNAIAHVFSKIQVAPGIPLNRPQTGHAPLKEAILTSKGQEQFAAQTWYDGLEFYGNTSLNPFFYGTYLSRMLI